jgi:RHS repeat-associated protein
MNSASPAASGRAGIGPRDITAGGANIARRAFSRSLLWLLVRFLPLLILTCQGISPAHANGVNTSIGDGEIKTGRITTTGVDTYTFPVNSTSSGLFFMISETGTHDSLFTPEIDIYRPVGTLYNYTWGAYYAYQRIDAAPVTGTWSIQVKRHDTSPGTSGGYYAVTVMTMPGPVSVSGGLPGGVMYPGVTYSGSTFRGDVDVYTFTGVAGTGNSAVLSLAKTGGSTGFTPEIDVFKPVGSYGYATWTATNTTLTINTSATAGTYTVLLFRHNVSDNTTGTYTLSVSGTGAGMPGDAKNDGKRCLACEAANQVTSTGGAAAGDPINIATGDVFEQVTDYTTVGTNPLALTRTYNSLSYKRNLYPTLMGPNWRTNYDRYLRSASSTQVAAERPDGQAINFTLISSVWTPDTDVDVKLTNSGTTYTLTDSDDTVETYTVASGKGTLNTIKLPNGYTQTMNYTTGVLTSVSDSYSRSLTFTYTGGVLTGVTTPDTATLTYGYTTTSGQQLLTSVTYNTSPTTNQTYVYANANLPFALTSITDENSNTNSQWAYDGSGRATSSQRAGGADLTTVSYDDSTGNRTVTDPLGNTETYYFSALQGVQKVNKIVRAANSPVAVATRLFTYDTNGYLSNAQDWNGNHTAWTNNTHGLPTSITFASGNALAQTTTISYDSTWVRKPYTTTKTNVTIDDRYDATQGTLLTHTLKDTTGGTTNNQTHIWTYTYNATGEMLTAQMPRTDATVKTIYTYTSGALASITDPLSNLTTINTANGTGQPTKITDPNSVETDLVYDNRNRLTSKTVKAGTNEVTTFTYIASGQPDLITLPDSSTVDFDYDTAQRLTTVTNTAGETINYTLNAAGKATTTTIKDSGGTIRKSSTATYDVLAHMLTLVGSAGATQTTSFAWDGQGNRTQLTDANSKVWKQAWDALNRASTVTDPVNSTAAPTYNNLDYVTAQTDFSGYSTSFTRDAFGNAIGRTSPDTGTASYVYDKDNNQTQRTDARSVVTNRTFDKLERPLTETFPSYTSENIAYTYDDTTGGNKGIGHLTKFTDESGSTTFVYDNFGNVTSSVRVIGTQTYTTSYSYDLENRLTEIIYPSGRYVDYTFDSSGYLTTVTSKPTSMGTVTTLASSIVHKPFGPIASFTYGNSEALTKTYDNNYWLTALNTVYSGTYVQELSFGQDHAGNLTSITDTLDSTRNETYTADALNRLWTAAGKYGSRTYTFTSNSNRLTWSDGTTTKTSHYTTGKNLLSSITYGSTTRTFTNSSSGNMATDDRAGGLALSNTYGGRDRLESMTVGTPTYTFKINALGQRVSKASVSTTTHFMFDLAGHIIGEANGSTGANQKEFVWMEGQLLAQIDSSGNYVFAHSNQVNAPQKITDSTRTLVWDRIQEPFGEDYSTPTNTTPTSHRFPGQYADSEDSLSYSNMRNYDQTTGRQNEFDPLGFGGGLNGFGYAGQNPTQNIDPTGLTTVDNIQTGVNAWYAQQHFNPPNVTSVGGHGYDVMSFDLQHPVFSTIYSFFTGDNYALTHISTTSDTFTLLNIFTDMNVKQIGDSISASGWTPGRPILYASCHAGQGLAQNVNDYLAAQTQSTVSGQGAAGNFTVKRDFDPSTYDTPYYRMDGTYLQPFTSAPSQ